MSKMKNLIEENKALVTEASWSKTLFFRYTNNAGETTPKQVEVYDLKADVFFGWDLVENKTKTFRYDRMDSVSIGEPFKPRFDKKVKD